MFKNKYLKIYVLYILGFYLVLCQSVASAENVRVAVASNFSATMKKLAEKFESETGNKVIISSASTGKLFAQIIHGAPYDIFFSADSKRAELLVKKSLAESAKIYAYGQLVYVIKKTQVKQCAPELHLKAIKKVALANPKTAPYGLAAQQVLVSLDEWDAAKSKVVMGENILQAYQFIATGNVDAGFIAKSIFITSQELSDFCQWLIPENLYLPIKQKMVLLKRSNNNSEARKFIRYINSATAKKIIEESGYRVN